MRDLVTGVLGTPWTLPVLFCVVATDAVVQFLPSATMVILTGMLAASGRIGVGWVIIVAAGATFTGDNLVYGLGRRGAPRLLRRARRGRRSRRFVDWAHRTMDDRPVATIILGRYMSGARLAVMVLSGVVGLPPRRFRRIAGFSAVLWATTTTMTGFLGGSVFVTRPVAGLLLVAGTATIVTVLSQLGMRGTRRYDSRVPGCLRWTSVDHDLAGTLPGAGRNPGAPGTVAAGDHPSTAVVNHDLA